MKLLRILPVFLFFAASPALFAAGPADVSDAKIARLEAMHTHAEDLILKNDFKGAIAVYDEILLEEPDDETAYTGMAQCQLVLGDFKRARNSYLNALHINPDNETAQLGLQKIQDPDSMNFTETEVRHVEVPAPAGEPAPPQAVETAQPLPAAAPEPQSVLELASPAPTSSAAAPASPVQTAQAPSLQPAPLDPAPEPASEPRRPVAPGDVELGARKTMAPYSVDLPKSLQGKTRGHQIQAALRNAGFYKGPIDGIIGNGTRRATKAFQEKYDLVPDGKVGPKTWELLQPFLNPNDLKEENLVGSREGN